VKKVNANQKLHLLEKIKAYNDGNLASKHLELWGLGFTPKLVDISEAPALSIIYALISEGAKVTAYDPEAMPNLKDQIDDKINYAESQFLTLAGADTLLIATEWSEFRTPDFEHMGKHIKYKVLFDGSYLFERPIIKELGYQL
jgi:UDPglucose 6-dehydrogenase